MTADRDAMSERDGRRNGPHPGDARPPLIGKDLWPRLVSGLALGAASLVLTLAGWATFTALVVVAALVLSWEFGRLVRGDQTDLVMGLHAGAVAAASILAGLGLVGPGLLLLSIGTILATLMSFGRRAVLSGLGVLYIGLPAIGLIWLRSDPDYGLAAVLYVIVTVVAADTAAYFAGRLIGGARLLARVSPNKTWAGLAGALVASAATGMVYARLVLGATSIRLATLSAALAFIAQTGDLLESSLKRRFGAKDASSLIPGHGGLMDRVDGLVAAAMVAALLAVAINVRSPGGALLLGH
jgi:phosphatidate cytidylyltransferase